MQYDSSPWQNDLFGLTSNQGAILTGNCFEFPLESSLFNWQVRRILAYV